MKYRALLVLTASLTMAGCIPDHWPAAWVKPGPARNQQTQNIWCYNTLAEVDCYDAPQTNRPTGQWMNPHRAVQKKRNGLTASKPAASTRKTAKKNRKKSPSRQAMAKKPEQPKSKMQPSHPSSKKKKIRKKIIVTSNSKSVPCQCLPAPRAPAPTPPPSLDADHKPLNLLHR